MAVSDPTPGAGDRVVEAGSSYAGHVPGDPLPDPTLLDQAGRPWTLSEHLDARALLVFLRGDW